MNRIFAATLLIVNFWAVTTQAADINVFAAASMKNALDEIGAAYKAKSGTGIVATYAATGILAKQIQAAAPADVFISADEAWMDELAKTKLIVASTLGDIAGNTLVVVKAKGDAVVVNIDKLADALGADKIALADIKSVPAGKYAKAALDKLGEWTAVEKNVVMQDNVRSALALVARREAKLGIVYGSDVKAEPKVEVAAIFAENTHAPIVYPAAVIAASKNIDAEKFVMFLKGPEAKAILLKDGFTAVK
jgi:molybdate transport system substrate-binding protein